MSDTTTTIRRQPVHLPPSVARALSPADLHLVSHLLGTDPGTWTYDEARALEAVRARAGEGAHRSLDRLIAQTEPVRAAHERPFRVLLDELGRINAELDRKTHHDVFGRKLASDRVSRAIREREQELRDEVQERWRPVIETAINPEHARRIEAQMRQELQQVQATASEMHRNRGEIEQREAEAISRQRQQERERRDRDLCLRRNEITKLLREAGIQAPAQEQRAAS